MDSCQRGDTRGYTARMAAITSRSSRTGQSWDRGTRRTFTVVVLRLTAVAPGVVVIQGRETGRFLAMSDEGRLYSTLNANDECCFLERVEENFYNTYQSQKYEERKWYVALKKNGKPKLGSRTHIGQNAVFFLPRKLGADPGTQ
ncbi:putative fibroblast growth factor 1 isoform X2 [Entelurus aequoreus]|uniref:putative fibroblast growth factor 1 isoform X2 n=1 Tax=Entelurus aequoreus TaxID=161455 RepID=UPI002B1E8EF5|nr:putative fibroblast growth factor 1 isoform X2 [Entelurus aequoreus]